MPVYDYKCQTHGIFNELGTLENAAQPAPCPRCNQLAARIIMVPAKALNIPTATKKGHEINERSQHAPLFSTNEQRQRDPKHAQQCGCASTQKKGQLIYTAKGEKMFPSMRPWMISH